MEDGAASMMQARLTALDADLDRVLVWQRATGEALPHFPSATPWLDEMVNQTGAVFVVIDPIVAFLDPRVLAEIGRAHV